MSLDFLFFCVIVLAIVMIERGIYRSFLTPTIAVAVPYLVTVFLDRTVGKKIGFPQITDTNILLLCLGICCFWIGSFSNVIIRNMRGRKVLTASKEPSADYYSKITKYVIVVEIITLIRYVFVFRRMGLLNYIGLDGGNGAMMDGLGAHLMFSMYPFIPQLFTRGILYKKRKYLAISGVALLEAFFTFTKYHVIFLVVASLLYLLIYKPEWIGAIAIMAIAGSSALFCVNYIVNFFAKEWVMEENYLLRHFLKYLLGSIVYSSLAPDIMLPLTDTASIIFSQFTAIPNLFTNYLFGFTIYPIPKIPYITIMGNETGNVMNLIAHVYSTHNYLAGSMFLLFLGMATTTWIYRSKNNHVKVYLLAILMMSFFVPFFQSLPPNEIIVYCIILPKLFQTRFRFGSKPLFPNMRIKK